jgi:hypothetical protein
MGLSFAFGAGSGASACQQSCSQLVHLSAKIKRWAVVVERGGCSGWLGGDDQWVKSVILRSICGSVTGNHSA